MIIVVSSGFERQYRKLPLEVKLDAEKRLIIFRKNPHNPALRTHKLKGELKDFWFFSIDYRHRIVFQLGKRDTAYFYAVGDHSIYQ